MNSHLRVVGKYIYPADVNSQLPPIHRFCQYDRNVRIFWDAINGKSLIIVGQRNNLSVQAAAKIIKEMRVRLVPMITDVADQHLQYQYLVSLRRSRVRWAEILTQWCSVYGLDTSFMDDETAH